MIAVKPSVTCGSCRDLRELYCKGVCRRCYDRIRKGLSPRKRAKIRMVNHEKTMKANRYENIRARAKLPPGALLCYSCDVPVPVDPVRRAQALLLGCIWAICPKHQAEVELIGYRDEDKE